MKPVIGDEAAMQLREEYLQMRSEGAKAAMANVVTATPRQLESMIRLSEALAKMRLSPEATVEDVNEALRLFKVSTLSAAKSGVVSESEERT